MRLADERNGMKLVIADRKDLRKFFDEQVWSCLPEGEHLYAFGVWWVGSIGCPIAQAFTSPGIVHGLDKKSGWSEFDRYCNNLLELERFGRPTPVPLVPQPEKEKLSVG